MMVQDSKKICNNDDSETGAPEDHLDMDAVEHHSPCCTMDHPHSPALSSSSSMSPDEMPLNPSAYHVDKLVVAPENENKHMGCIPEGCNGACDEIGHSHRHTSSCSSSSSRSPSVSTISSSSFPSDHVLSTPSTRNSIDSAMQDDLFRQLRATLPPSASSPEPSILSSGSSTPRASDYYRWQYSTRETASTSTASIDNTAATTPSYTTPSISSSSGSSSPERKHHHRRHQSSTLTSSIGTHALTSVIQKTSQAATSLVKTVDLNQAISLSLYFFVTLLAGVTLVSILVAGYGLTLADDAKMKIGRWSREADLKRRRIMIDIEEWVKFANEQLKHQKTALEQGHYGSPSPSSSSSTFRKRRASYPQAAKRNGKFTSSTEDQRSIPKNTSEALKSTLRTYATLAYLKSPFTNQQSSNSSSSSSPRHRQKSKSQPSSRPRSRCSTPPPERFSSSFPSFAPSSSASSHSWNNKLPPRPPLSVLIPSMMLAVVLALIAFFKNGSKSSNANTRSRSSFSSSPSSSSSSTYRR